MEKNKRILLVTGSIFVLISVFMFIFNRRVGRGLLTGYAIGLVNYFLITISVKRILSLTGAISGKVMISGILYFFRFLLVALVIAAVLTVIKTCSLTGFLTGFSFFIGSVVISNKIPGIKIKPFEQVTK